MNNPICPVCGERADKTCSGCHLVSYCSASHQKQDWKEHRKSCRLYTIKKNDVMGRYLVAARDIPEGTIILSESPLAIGPKQNTRPLCLGCYKFVNGSYTCSRCHFPLCGPACEKVPMHAENECQVFQNLPVKITYFDKFHPVYECILTVRCLVLRDHDQKKWAALNEMEHHNDIRRENLKELWHRNQVNTVNYLRERYKMVEFDEDTIHSVLGYADVNSFEIRLEKNNTGICGLYPNIYIMAHDCLSNTHHTVTDDYRMIVRSAVPIKKGQLITTAYTHTLDGTLERRQNVKLSKFFDCVCVRCASGTELNTHFSSVKCPNCPKGYLVPLDSLDRDSNWKCDECSGERGVDNVLELVQQIKGEMDEIKEGENLIPRLEKLLEKHSGKTVHPNHYLLMSISHSLSELYGRTTGWVIDSLSMESLLRKENHCRKLLAVLDVLEPGFTRIRGLTLYELHAALYFIAKAKFQQNLIDPFQLRVELEEVLRLLHEAEYILLFDTATSAEGIIANSIPESISSVKLVMKHCCNIP